MKYIKIGETHMENSKLNRINELAKLAKERELTAEELSERDALRKEYIAEWRRGAEQVLENTYIVTPDGKKRKLTAGVHAGSVKNTGREDR